MEEQRLKILLAIAVLYFGLHLVVGWYRCHVGFCPGDIEADWIYEFVDDDGKKYIHMDGKTILASDYIEMKKHEENQKK